MTLMEARFRLYLDGDPPETSEPFRGWCHGAVTSLPGWELPLLEPAEAERFWAWFSTSANTDPAWPVAYGHEEVDGQDAYWVNFDPESDPDHEHRYIFPRVVAEGREVYDFAGLTWVFDRE